MIFLLATCAAAQEKYSRPNYHLGFTDYAGRMLLWRDVSCVRPEKGEAIPLRLRFGTHLAGSPLFGKFWYCPLLESTLLPANEQKLTWMTLGGRTVYLRARKDGDFRSGDGAVNARKASPSEWILTANGDEYRYVSGKLRTVKFSDGHELEWVYQGSKLMGIMEKPGGMVLVLEYASNSPFPIAIVTGPDRVEFQYQKVPVVSLANGVPVIAGFEESLAEFWIPGNREKFPVRFEPTGEFVMDFSASYGKKANRFVWDAATSLLKSDGDWTYSVSQPGPKGAMVSRTNKKGETESYFYNSKTGESEHCHPDGTITKRSYFVAGGPAQYKMRKATDFKNGKEIGSLQWSYDDKGRLIREICGNFEKTLTWSDDGKLLGELEKEGDEILWQITYDAEGRTVEERVKNNVYRFAYEGGKTVRTRIRDGEIASTRVLESATGRVLYFNPDAARSDSKGRAPALSEKVSPQDVAAAEALAVKSIQSILNEKAR